MCFMDGPYIVKDNSAVQLKCYNKTMLYGQTARTYSESNTSAASVQSGYTLTYNNVHKEMEHTYAQPYIRTAPCKSNATKCYNHLFLSTIIIGNLKIVSNEAIKQWKLIKLYRVKKHNKTERKNSRVLSILLLINK